MSIHQLRKVCAFTALAPLLSLSACGGSGFSSLPDAQWYGRHGGGSTPVPTETSTPAPNLSFSSYITEQGQWLAQHQLKDGAIAYSNTNIEPYFANIAATGWLKIPSQLANVRAWIAWYVAHLNAADIWNLGGTIYDYTYTASGAETSTQSADSVDSYAATFLTLVRELYDTSDAVSQAYVLSLQPTLDRLGTTLLALQQHDGMTIAMPSYAIAYLEDNCEVYRGLRDLAYLDQRAFLDPVSAARYTTAATQVAAGIDSLWNASVGAYAYAKGEPGGSSSAPSWSIWYPDATSQLFPILEGVIFPTSSRAIALWSAFNAAFPQWDQLVGSDAFPWALVGDSAAMMSDVARSDAYVQNVQKSYGASGFPWPWYDAESGWYIRMNDQLLSGPSLLTAEN